MKDKLTKKDFSTICERIPSDKKIIADKLIEELIFMTETLEDLKKNIRESGTVEHFKQGKQDFLRENPALKSYNTTIQRYSLLYRQLSDLAGKSPEAERSNPVYDFIKEGLEE